MAAADALSLGEGGGPQGSARWLVAAAFALALHAGLLLYLRSAPTPHQFDNQQAIEIDMAPPPTPAGAQAPAEEASEAQPQELPEITPDEVVPPDEKVETVETETPPEELEEITPPETATTVDQLEVVETPPDVAAAVTLPPPTARTLPPEETVTAQEEVAPPPPPTPKPVVRREEPKPKPVERERKPVERPKPPPQAQRGEVRQQARQGATQASAAAAARQGATGGNPAASRAAAAAYGGRVRSAINAVKSCVAGVNGQAVVSFTVNRSGNVTSARASGPGPVASAAQAMVRRAGIPPMPAEMTGSSASYSLPISLRQC